MFFTPTLHTNNFFFLSRYIIPPGNSPIILSVCIQLGQGPLWCCHVWLHRHQGHLALEWKRALVFVSSVSISLFVFFLKDVERKLMRIIYMPKREGETVRESAAQLSRREAMMQVQARRLIPPANDPASGMQTLGEFRWGGFGWGRVGGLLGCHSARRPLRYLCKTWRQHQRQAAVIKEGGFRCRRAFPLRAAESV